MNEGKDFLAVIGALALIAILVFFVWAGCTSRFNVQQYDVPCKIAGYDGATWYADSGAVCYSRVEVPVKEALSDVDHLP